MTLKGAAGLHARFRAVAKAPSGMMRTIALSAVRNQKKLAPVKTGNLRRSIHLGAVGPRTAYTIASAKYAAAVEFGTGPHVIVPRRRKVLRFSAGGRVVFAKRVNHPGTRPQPFMQPGAEAALRDAGVEVIVQAWNRAD